MFVASLRITLGQPRETAVKTTEQQLCIAQCQIIACAQLPGRAGMVSGTAVERLQAALTFAPGLPVAVAVTQRQQAISLIKNGLLN